MNLKIGKLNCCQICEGKNFQKIINFGKITPCDSLVTKANLNKKQNKYPLNLIRCRSCGLVQIDYVVDPKELFHLKYPYKSGITKDLKNNLEKISKHVSKSYKNFTNKLVIDIGSNDGSILKGFKKIGYNVLGVEPTDIAKIARKNGINTMQNFFSMTLANKIKNKFGSASIITASNVFAHVNKIGDLLKGVYNLLDDDGVFVTESHYLGSIIDTLQFDSIYHEHLKYYSIKPMIILFKKYNFIFEKVEKISNYGGSIRVYARKNNNNKFQVGKSVINLLNHEIKKGYYKDVIFKKFSKKISNFKNKFQYLIYSLKKTGKNIIGIGCPGRAMTLLEYCKFNSKIISYIAEQKESLKLGMYTPGTKIPVVDEKRAIKSQPDYAIMLSWHYAKSIIKNLRKKGLKSKIIIPLPNIKFVK
jgi:hypothetical protein